MSENKEQINVTERIDGENRELAEQFYLTGKPKLSFKEMMDDFMTIIPLHQRYTRFAGYLVKDFITNGFPLASGWAKVNVVFHEEDNTVKYMHVCRDAIYGDNYIAIIVNVKRTSWEVFLAEFKYENGKTEYLYMKSVGQPEDICRAFLDYRDGYLHEQHLKEEKQKYIDTHPDEDPEPCLKATKEEPKKPNWFMKLISKIFG